MTENIIIGKIEEVRRINNRLWMDILRVAMNKAPVETREILTQITRNDREVSRLTELLAQSVDGDAPK